ncbi:MAG: UDP-3-O-(3-hydroxymyristoyl)glucosamine N-acyltransferase [Chlamydiota bacterium]|nr:UDP-3-O-(3-hydroxymyristoyl)glucosamine N-acyltransferase [Chlamydiota bacterium]
MHKKFFTLAEIAEMTDSKLIGDPEYLISNVSDLQSAEPEDASFFANPRYEQVMKSSRAGAIFVSTPQETVKEKNFLINEDPSRAFQVILEAFHSVTHKLTGFSETHPSAVIHDTAFIGKNVSIGPNAVIDQDVKIGDNTFIGAGCYVGASVSIGENCLVHPNVTIRELCKVGNNVILHPGVVIGSCGFGLTTDKNGKHQKLCQVGIVTIEDDVEIGANSTIDRSRFKSTRIGRGTKIDNLVQIGHGVQIGEDNIIVSQTGIAGSSETGNHVIMGGQVGIAGHVSICSNVAIAAKSGISKSITQPGNYRGVPAVPIVDFNRNTVHLRNIGKLVKRLQKVENELNREPAGV